MVGPGAGDEMRAAFWITYVAMQRK
jgi:hypothetical protein